MIRLADLDLASGKGTGLRGSLEVSYADLIEILGPPHYKGDDNQLDVGWAYEYNETVFTIYSHTGVLDEEGHVKDITGWHVGGHSHDVIDIVHALLVRSGVKFKLNFRP